MLSLGLNIAFILGSVWYAHKKDMYLPVLHLDNRTLFQSPETGITTFNLELGSWWEGFWERLVAIVKCYLKKNEWVSKKCNLQSW